jgi:predicted nuclease of predicted toxin-antitoxin system
MELRLLADTHIAKEISRQLRNRGIDIVRLEELENLATDSSDADILRYAVEDERAVLSLDDDFEQLHFEYIAQQKRHKGIFLGNRRLQGTIGVIVNFIIEYAELIESDDDIHNQLIYIK